MLYLEYTLLRAIWIEIRSDGRTNWPEVYASCFFLMLLGVMYSAMAGLAAKYFGLDGLGVTCAYAIIIFFFAAVVFYIPTFFSALNKT